MTDAEAKAGAKTVPDYGETGYISVAGLKARGWSVFEVARLLGDPDRTAVNPHYSSAAPVKLYSVIRAAQAESELRPRRRVAVESLWPAARIVAARGQKWDETLALVSDGFASVKEASGVLGCGVGAVRRELGERGMTWPAQERRVSTAANPSAATLEIREKTEFEVAYQEAVRIERGAREQGQRQGQGQGRAVRGKIRGAHRLEQQGLRCEGADAETGDGRCVHQRRQTGVYCRRCEKIFGGG